MQFVVRSLKCSPAVVHCLIAFLRDMFVGYALTLALKVLWMRQGVAQRIFAMRLFQKDMAAFTQGVV